MGDGTRRDRTGRLAGMPIAVAGQWSPAYLNEV